MSWEAVIEFFKVLHWQTVVAVFQALLTPTIAFLAVVVAVAQYQLAKAKFRHELYERRSAVYKAAMKFIAQASGGNAKLDELQTFLRDTSEAAFLFTHAKQIQPFLKELYMKGVDLHTTTNKLLESSGDPQHDKHADKMGDLLLYLASNLTNAPVCLRRICCWCRG
jgi:hypothetical protein